MIFGEQTLDKFTNRTFPFGYVKQLLKCSKAKPHTLSCFYSTVVCINNDPQLTDEKHDTVRRGCGEGEVFLIFRERDEDILWTEYDQFKPCIMKKHKDGHKDKQVFLVE